MLRAIVHKILLRRHFWRYATFGEVAELYVSRMLRMMAVYMAASFGSVYLYQNGYSVQFIALFWMLYYLFKVTMDLPMAQYAARFGPKHGTLLSNLLYIPAMISLTLVPEYGTFLLIMTGVMQGISASLYGISYNINFSKVKTFKHAGKEIAYMNIFEKITTGVSPLVGGFIALYFGPAAALIVSAVFFALSAVPLFHTGEPHEVDRKLVFRGFPWHMAWRSLVANIGVGSDAAVLRVAWPLFIAITIVGMSSGDVVYAVLGSLASLVALADILFSYTYGRLIDRERGGILLKYGVIGTALTYIVRAFVSTVPGAAAINIANEATAISYVMAFTRGVFDVADRTGHRATYVGFVQMLQDAGAALFAFVIFLMVSFYDIKNGLRASFFIGAVILLIVLIARFPLYRKR